MKVRCAIPLNHRDAGKTSSERFRSEKPQSGFSRGPSEELDFPELGPGVLRSKEATDIQMLPLRKNRQPPFLSEQERGEAGAYSRNTIP